MNKIRPNYERNSVKRKSVKQTDFERNPNFEWIDGSEDNKINDKAVIEGKEVIEIISEW